MSYTFFGILPAGVERLRGAVGLTRLRIFQNVKCPLKGNTGAIQGLVFRDYSLGFPKIRGTVLEL